MELERKLAGFGGTSLHFILLLMVLLLCLGLGGCSKNCADSEKELTRYADGSQPIGDEAKVLKECKAVLDKCVGQTVPYEVMGDIDAKNKKFDDAVRNYEKVLVTNSGNERVKGKIDKINKAVEEAAAALVASIKTMPVSKYAGLDESVRMTWCEGLLAQGRAGGGGRVEVIYNINARQLDAELMRLAASAPHLPTGDAAVKYVMGNMTLRKR
ncbi:MAG: hypothetical protein CSYNP_04201 [Syntrophus sp. SKADARSKE-3]|nr:hypothetical protein [Syntrophus sp. SKADARSKE-3]